MISVQSFLSNRPGRKPEDKRKKPQEKGALRHIRKKGYSLSALFSTHNDRFLENALLTEQEYLDHILDAGDSSLL